MLTPLDLHNKEFRRAFRGFDCEEVDAFIAELIQTWEVLTQTEKWRVEKGVPVTQEGKKLLTPMEIHHKKFRRRFRGYDVDDVNDFLDRVIQSAEQLIKEKV